jgi:protein-S-isoprenylcysteine O-methyltransferase Ste14
MVQVVVITIVAFIILSGCLFVTAGTISWPLAWAVMGIYLLSKLIALVFADPELLKERVAPGPGGDQRDKVIAALGYIGLYPGTFIVAGIDAVRLGPAVQIPISIKMAALLVFALGYGFASWTFLSNPFFSTFVRIQEDRDHKVISSGAYALVRHPGYAGVLFSHIVLPFALGSVWALVPTSVGTIFFIVRTAREDHILQDHLAGYRDYQARVLWRLFPGVW